MRSFTTSYRDTGQERPWKRRRKDGLDREEGTRGKVDANADNIARKCHRSPLPLLGRGICIESLD